MSKRTAKIFGRGILYEFELLEALNGVYMYHQKIKGWMDKMKDAESTVSHISSLEIAELYEVGAFLLANSKIGDDQCDETGMCETFARKPHVMYEALMFSLAANYPDYFPFLLTEEADMTEAPSQG